MTDQETSSSLLRDYGATVAIAVAVALMIRLFVIEAYRIPSAAMRPALEPGDTIFVEKWPFGLRLPWTDTVFSQGRIPHHGEIVVFTPIADQRRDYIKRVLGLPGDLVELQSGKFFLNGVSTEVEGEKKANCAVEKTPEAKSYPVCFEKPLIENFGPMKVPEGSVFVVGDLRSQSPVEFGHEKDIRGWGIVPLKILKGSALWIWLSVDPTNRGSSTSLFPSIRFDRMFRRVQ